MDVGGGTTSSGPPHTTSSMSTTSTTIFSKQQPSPESLANGGVTATTSGKTTPAVSPAEGGPGAGALLTNSTTGSTTGKAKKKVAKNAVTSLMSLVTAQSAGPSKKKKRNPAAALQPKPDDGLHRNPNHKPWDGAASAPKMPSPGTTTGSGSSLATTAAARGGAGSTVGRENSLSSPLEDKSTDVTSWYGKEARAAKPQKNPKEATAGSSTTASSGPPVDQGTTSSSGAAPATVSTTKERNKTKNDNVGSSDQKEATTCTKSPATDSHKNAVQKAASSTAPWATKGPPTGKGISSNTSCQNHDTQEESSLSTTTVTRSTPTNYSVFSSPTQLLMTRPHSSSSPPSGSSASTSVGPPSQPLPPNLAGKKGPGTGSANARVARGGKAGSAASLKQGSNKTAPGSAVSSQPAASRQQSANSNTSAVEQQSSSVTGGDQRKVSLVAGGGAPGERFGTQRAGVRQSVEASGGIQPRSTGLDSHAHAASSGLNLWEKAGLIGGDEEEEAASEKIKPRTTSKEEPSEKNNAWVDLGAWGDVDVPSSGPSSGGGSGATAPQQVGTTAASKTTSTTSSGGGGGPPPALGGVSSPPSASQNNSALAVSLGAWGQPTTPPTISQSSSCSKTTPQYLWRKFLADLFPEDFHLYQSLKVFSTQLVDSGKGNTNMDTQFVCKLCCCLCVKPLVLPQGNMCCAVCFQAHVERGLASPGGEVKDPLSDRLLSPSDVRPLDQVQWKSSQHDS